MERSEHSAGLRLALADAIDIVADAVIMLDEDLCILYFNQGAERIFGYSAPEILNRSLDVLLPSRFVAAHHNRIPAFAATLQVVRLMGDPLQVRGRRKDGSEFPAEVSLSKLVKDGRTTFTVIVRDVTDRLGTDEVLRRWIHIFDHVEWGVVIGSADGRAFERVNPAFARMHGYTVEELVGRPITDVFAPDSQSELPNQIRLAHEKGHHTFESQHIRKDGTVFPVLVDVTTVKDEAGRVLHRIVNVQDITERSRAETALRESEERYRSIVAAMQEGIVFQDADGRIIACNASAERILRLAGDQMMGRTSFDPRWRAIHEDGSPFAGDTHPAMVTLRTGQPQSNVIMSIHKPDETVTWISINSQPLFRPGEAAPSAVVTSFTDITARKRAEQSLRESEERYRLLFDNSLDGILLTAPDGSVLTANPAACRMFGRTEEEIRSLGRSGLADLSDPRLAPALEERARTGKFRTELFHLHKDGTRFPCEVSSSVFKDKDGHLRTSMIIRDVTERERAEEALRESEDRYRSIVAAMQDGMVFQDADGRISACNASAERILGLARDEMMGRTPMDPRWQVVHEDGTPFPGEIRPAMVTLRTGQPQSNVIMGVYKPDGTLAWISTNSQPLFRPGEAAPYAVVSSFTDITERRQAYQLLEQRVAERTRELSTLLKISHNVASTLELGPLMRLILEQLSFVVNYTSAAIFTLEGEELVILEYQVPTLGRPALPLRLPLGEAGLGQQVIRCREPVIVDDVQGDIPLARAVQRSGRADVKTLFSYAHSWMAIPLIAKDKVIGMLGLAHEEPGYYTAQHAKLVLTIANQAAVAMENARLYEHARQLSALEERQRLARELHDSVSQALYSIALGARTARTWLERDPPKAAEPLDYVRSLAEAGLAEMRALIFELRPESLENEGLAAALTKQTDALRARYGIDVQVNLCDEPVMSMKVREALYRIAQEALHNTIKHARASRVDVALSCSDTAIILQVADNGPGFDTAEPFPGHLGLRSMRERAECVGGTFEVNSSLGTGTHIRVQIPKPVS